MRNCELTKDELYAILRSLLQDDFVSLEQVQDALQDDFKALMSVYGIDANKPIPIAYFKAWHRKITLGSGIDYEVAFKAPSADF